MTPAEMIARLLPSRYWGNPEWKAIDKVLADDGLVIVSVEDLAETIRDADQLSLAVGHDDESDTRLDRLRALLPPELIDDKDGARRG